MPGTVKQYVWIGGAPCAGKSLLAERLSVDLHFPVYHADEHFDEHAQQVDRGTVLKRISGWSPEQIFLRNVEQMVADFVSVSYDEFPLILKDLEATEWNHGAIVEGCALLPELVSASMMEADSAVFLVPTEDFQRHHYALRPWIHDLLSKTSNRQAAWENWRARDARFADVVIEQAIEANLPVVEVDGKLTLDQIHNEFSKYVVPR